ncbi:hypothetical protein QPK87_12290 [Kamptonema cortianum]|nr:hypothetical protein [Kamptonema cortianum]
MDSVPLLNYGFHRYIRRRADGRHRRRWMIGDPSPDMQMSIDDRHAVPPFT